MKKRNSYFEDLKEGLNEAIEFAQGKIDLRTTELEIPDLPPKVSKGKIKSLREDVLHMSQPVFAKFFGVSSASVKAWEQGRNSPDGAARRLLQIVEMNPQILTALPKRKTTTKIAR